MNSERKLFEDHYKKIFGDIGFDYLKTDGSYSNDMKNNMWLSWQASTQRQGYKLVPVEPTRNMEIAGMNAGAGFVSRSIYKAMIGAVNESR